MAGRFELFNAPGGGYSVRLLDDSGSILVISVRYRNKKAAARGITTIREIAASGLIHDQTERGIAPGGALPTSES